MAGYSGTPLPKKLGIKEQFRVSLVGMPSEVKAELQETLAECQNPRNGPYDFAMVFAKSASELKKNFRKYFSRLDPAGMLWVSWPKKSSGVATDLTEDRVREIGLEAGLVDVKVCAVNEIWSGLKFVARLKDRKSPSTRL